MRARHQSLLPASYIGRPIDAGRRLIQRAASARSETTTAGVRLLLANRVNERFFSCFLCVRPLTRETKAARERETSTGSTSHATLIIVSF